MARTETTKLSLPEDPQPRPRQPVVQGRDDGGHDNDKHKHDHAVGDQLVAPRPDDLAQLADDLAVVLHDPLEDVATRRSTFTSRCRLQGNGRLMRLGRHDPPLLPLPGIAAETALSLTEPLASNEQPAEITPCLPAAPRLAGATGLEPAT